MNKPLSAVVVQASGEVDAATAPQLVNAIGTAAEMGVPLVVVDLSQVTFLSSAGIGTLIDATTNADAAGQQLRVVADPRHFVSRILEITGLTERLAIFDTLSAAIPVRSSDS